MAENKTIIRLYFAKMKEAFNSLSEEEKIAFMQKDWSNDKWDYVGVEEWPSIEAIESREQFENEELEVFKYVESKTLLGTPESFTDYGK